MEWEFGRLGMVLVEREKERTGDFEGVRRLMIDATVMGRDE